jgi:hypothetical membrane protein
MRRAGEDRGGRRTRVLALLGLAGIAEFVLAALALHVVSLGDEPSHMSEFAHSRFWLVWVLGLYTLVLGCGTLAWAMGPCLSRTRWQRVGMALLSLAGLAAAVLATFPVDEGRYESTLVGTIHNDATLTTFLMLSAAMVVLGPAFRATPAWRSFARTSLGIGVAVGTLGVVYLVTTEQEMASAAFWQRILVAIIASWFVLVALRLRRMPTLAAPQPEGAGVAAAAASNSFQSRSLAPRAPTMAVRRGRTRSM